MRLTCFLPPPVDVFYGWQMMVWVSSHLYPEKVNSIPCTVTGRIWVGTKTVPPMTVSQGEDPLCVRGKVWPGGVVFCQHARGIFLLPEQTAGNRERNKPRFPQSNPILRFKQIIIKHYIKKILNIRQCVRFTGAY